MKLFTIEGNTHNYQFTITYESVVIKVLSNNTEEPELIDEITIDKDVFNENC